MPTKIKLSQKQKIIMLMCRRRKQEWWLPYHFMEETLGDLFVGYEASARLSELAREYPDMVETGDDGKYKKRRLRWETFDAWFPNLPKDLRYVFHATGQDARANAAQHTTPTLEAQVTPAEDGKPALLDVEAVYIGRASKYDGRIRPGDQYTLRVQSLTVGQPVRLLEPIKATYYSIKSFRADWRAL